uniref:Uncharacterized protein LOC114338666 n=1 Tax=Diabrotica virgifera virgifera TaxID=50390 RepID=A0A6P7G7N8_DIAVI
MGKSFLWNHFTKIPNSDFFAFCNICKRELSYKTTTTNLKRHLERVHSEELSTFGELNSLLWNYFTKITNSDDLAYCNICNEQFSYKNSVSNLTEHLESQHPEYISDSDRNNTNSMDFSSIDEATSSNNFSSTPKKPVSHIWEYFTKGVNMLATCNICNHELSCIKISDLQNHLERQHPNSVIGNENILENFVDCSGTEKNDFGYVEPGHRKTVPQLWEYFTKISDMQAYCNFCHQQFSYKSSTSNLKEHLRTNHSVVLPLDKESNNVYLDLNMSDVFSISQTATNEPTDPFNEENLNCTQEYFVTLGQGAKDMGMASIQPNPPAQSVQLIQSPNEISVNIENREGDLQKEGIDTETISKINQFKNDQDIGEYISDKTRNSCSTGNADSSKDTSFLWEFFTKVSPLNYLAECNLCSKVISFKSTTFNLQKHMTKKHPEELNKEQSDLVSTKTKTDDITGIKRPSTVWNYFTKDTFEMTISCNLCKYITSYRSSQGSTGNLWKHIARKHPQLSDQEASNDEHSDDKSVQKETEGENSQKDRFNSYADEDSDSNESDTDEKDTQKCRQQLNKDDKRHSSVWKYFKKLSPSNIPQCNICLKKMSSKSGTSNLWKHLNRKHSDISADTSHSDQTSDNEEVQVNSDDEKGDKRHSSVWKYFKKLSPSNIPQCNICLKKMSSKSGTSNLWKHLTRKHYDISFDKDNSYSDPTSGNEEVQVNSDDEKHGKRNSSVWKYFKKLSPSNIPQCNICLKKMSRKSGTSNLWKHLNRKHPDVSTDKDDSHSDQTSDNEDVQVNSDDEKDCSKQSGSSVQPNLNAKSNKEEGNRDEEVGTRKRSSVWKFFTKVPFSDISRCNLCQTKMTYKSGTTSNLRKHLARKHPELSVDKDGSFVQEKEPLVESTPQKRGRKSTSREIKAEVIDTTCEEVNTPRKRASSVWNYFKKLPNSKIPVCKICNVQMSSKSGTSNLWRHIAGKHPDIKADNDESSSDEESDDEEPRKEEERKPHDNSIKLEEIEISIEDKKGKKKRSSVWNYFVKLSPSNTLRCNICKTEMSSKSGTSNLWRHIAGKHPEIQTDKDCSSSDEDSDDDDQVKTQKCKREKIKFEIVDRDSTDEEKKGGKKRSTVWKYFTKLPNSNIPCCNICKAQMSSKSGTSNLWRHIAGKHHNIHKEKEGGSSTDEHSDNDSVSEDELKDTSKRRSSIWRYFSIVSDSDTARCNYCGVELAYKSSTGNLWKHVARKHPDETSNIINESTSEESSDDDEEPQNDDHNVQSKMWKYFTKVSDSDFLASCNYCQKRFSYKTSTGNLKKHVYRKHSKQLAENSEDDTDENTSSDGEQKDSNSGKKVSPMWKLFRKVPNSDYIACCRLCRKRISYKTTTSNLQRHIGRRHPKYLSLKYRNRISYTARRRNTALCARNAQKYKNELLNFNKSGSSLWDLFSKIEASDSIASCKICRNQLSYKTTTGNLKKHMYRKHRSLLPNEQPQDQVQSYSEHDEDQKDEIPEMKVTENTDNIPIQTVSNDVDNIDDDDFWNMDTASDSDDPEFRPSPTFEEEIDVKTGSTGKKRSLIWNVFTEKPFSNFVAICNVCNQEFCYRSTTNNLKKHFQRKHPKLSLEHKIERVVEESTGADYSDVKAENKRFMDDDDRDSSDEAVSNSKRKRSQIWNYFTRKKPGEYVATCNLCKKELGFRSTTSNLKKHLDRKHPNIEIKSESDDVKKDVPEVPVKTCLICLQTDQTETREFVTVQNLDLGEGEKTYMTKIQEIMNQPVVIDETHVLCQTCVEDIEKVIQFKEKISKAFEFWSKIEAEPEPEPFDNFADDTHQSDYSDLEDGESLAKFTCSKCNKVFPSPSVMLKHNCGQQPRKEKPAGRREVVDKDNKYYCEHCGKCFNIKWKLNKHLKKCQIAAKQFVCTLCNRVFKKAYHLREHMASHTGERNYSCNLCGKTFQRSSSKHKHMRSHNAKPGEKSKKTPFLCTICGKSFPYSNGASRHMRVHLGERRHECHICLKRFSQTTHLKVHLRTHSGERPYGCMICGRTFSLNASLRKHMRLHVGSGDFVKLVKNFETNLAPGEMVATDGLHVLTAVTQDIEMDANQCIA